MPKVPEVESSSIGTSGKAPEGCPAWLEECVDAPDGIGSLRLFRTAGRVVRFEAGFLMPRLSPRPRPDIVKERYAAERMGGEPEWWEETFGDG